MKLFMREHNPKFRTISKIYDEKRNAQFSKLWLEKKYSEALSNYFPNSWEWIGQDTSKQLICDYPMNHGAGQVVSEKVFKKLRKRFPLETNLNHSLQIDGLNYFWFSPPVINDTDINSTTLNIFICKPRFITVYTESFTKILKETGFSGAGFIEIDNSFLIS